MDIPINATIQCTDGPQGRSICVIVNPVTERVTHVVVKEEHSPHAERLVPVSLVRETMPELIRLDCTGDELARQRPFVNAEFVRAEMPILEYEGDEVMIQPYTVLEVQRAPIKRKIKSVAPGEFAVHRGTRVEAADGPIGKIEEFVVEPADGYITHLVLRKGHAWGQKQVTIPVPEVARTAENAVHLRLNKRQIGALPAIPVRRKWF